MLSVCCGSRCLVSCRRVGYFSGKCPALVAGLFGGFRWISLLSSGRFWGWEISFGHCEVFVNEEDTAGWSSS